MASNPDQGASPAEAIEAEAVSGVHEDDPQQSRFVELNLHTMAIVTSSCQMP